jgi:hypothetical protein
VTQPGSGSDGYTPRKYEAEVYADVAGAKANKKAGIGSSLRTRPKSRAPIPPSPRRCTSGSWLLKVAVTATG